MRRIVETEVARSSVRRRRGFRGQRRRRRRERAAREAAVAYVRCFGRRGLGTEAAAEHLELCPRTLRRWADGWREDRLRPRARGRPILAADAEQRAEVFGTLAELGPGIGVPALRGLFPDLGRRDLEELVRRYRHAVRRGRRVTIHALRWRQPGSVWAMDFTEPPAPVDGLYDQLFCVRDLPSHYQLWSLPTIGKHSRTVVDSLEALVRWYGAPLVLKLDNDGVFRSGELRDWARRHGVQLLYSPPYRPSYNGSAECGIGALKVRAHFASAVKDRPGEWSCDDIEQARLQMNALGRPQGVHGPSPETLWRERTPVTGEQREDFGRRYRWNYALECARHGFPWGVELRHEDRSAVDRSALARTLTKLGYLLIRRRRISLPFHAWKVDKIS